MKKISFMIFALVLTATLSISAFAANDYGATSSDIAPGAIDNSYVMDNASLLSSAEQATLEAQAQQISEQYQCGVYIITVDDFTDYANTSRVLTAAEKIYTQYGLGMGDDQSGLLLLLSMSERDYALLSHGYGGTAFTDYGKDQLIDAFLDDFGDNDWYDGFSDYLDKSGSMLRSARDGHPVTANSDPVILVVGILISIGLGCIIATAVCLILRGSMKSVFKKAEANEYIHSGSVDFTLREDHFTHATQTRVKIQQKSNSGGGGFSGKSGKF